MAQGTNALLQRLGRAQLWPQQLGVSSRSLAYADQQFKAQFSNRVLTLLLAYGIIMPVFQPWAYLFRRNRPTKPNYNLQIPAVRGEFENQYQVRNLYYSLGVWYEGRFVVWADRERRVPKYAGLHWGYLRVFNVGVIQIVLLRGLTTNFAVGAEMEMSSVWQSTTPLKDSIEDETPALAAWTRASVNNWDTARSNLDVITALATFSKQDIDTRCWL